MPPLRPLYHKGHFFPLKIGYYLYTASWPHWSLPGRMMGLAGCVRETERGLFLGWLIGVLASQFDWYPMLTFRALHNYSSWPAGNAACEFTWRVPNLFRIEVERRIAIRASDRLHGLLLWANVTLPTVMVGRRGAGLVCGRLYQELDRK